MAALALACAAAGGPLGTPARAEGGCAGTGLTPVRGDLSAVREAALCLLNRLRAAHGLPSLRANHALARVAASQAHAMFNGNYFADVRPGGLTPLALVAHSPYAVRSNGLAVGQASAWGTISKATPARIMAALIASPPHLAVMLDGGYRDVGIATLPAVPRRLSGGARGATYVLVFGARL